MAGVHALRAVGQGKGIIRSLVQHLGIEIKPGKKHFTAEAQTITWM
jgi:hypothetical protein